MYLINHLRSFARNEEGQDLIEYAMLVALIALFCVVAVTAAGGKVVAVFNAIVAAIPGVTRSGTRLRRLTESSVRVEGRARRIVMDLIARLRSFARNDEGQDLIEYAMLVALIALFCVVAVTAAGGKVAEVFNAIVAAIPA